MDESPAERFINKLKNARAKELYQNIPFLRSLRHDWEAVTVLHKHLGKHLDMLYMKNIYDIVIESETRSLPASSGVTRTPRKIKEPIPSYIQCAFIPPELVRIIYDFMGVQEEPEEREEICPLPPDGSYPMVNTLFPMVRCV